MLKPSLVVNAVISTLQTIAPFVAAMNGPQNIKAHSFVNGQVVPIMTDIYEMTAPSCLVVYEGTLGGNFDGMTIWKHLLTIYLKAPNQATIQTPLGYEDLVWMVVNGEVNSTQLNIRQISVIPEVSLMDTPTITRMTDESRTDFFKVECVFPEIGDSM
ncbi:MAG TPA: hypothetical protein VGN17_03980 [Bryobacteraceae bacterium]|jgi:hypothetical protein